MRYDLMFWLQLCSRISSVLWNLQQQCYGSGSYIMQYCDRKHYRTLWTSPLSVGYMHTCKYTLEITFIHIL